MNNEYITLRNEFEGTNNSFIFKLRGEFIWDKELFSRLIEVMKLVCKENENSESIEKWVASVFWYMSSFVKEHTLHPEFPRPYDPDYYRRAFLLIGELGTWLFTGNCPVINSDEHFNIQ
jgi:hypothetical protein